MASMIPLYISVSFEAGLKFKEPRPFSDALVLLPLMLMGQTNAALRRIYLLLRKVTGFN